MRQVNGSDKIHLCKNESEVKAHGISVVEGDDERVTREVTPEAETINVKPGGYSTECWQVFENEFWSGDMLTHERGAKRERLVWERVLPKV